MPTTPNCSKVSRSGWCISCCLLKWLGQPRSWWLLSWEVPEWSALSRSLPWRLLDLGLGKLPSWELPSAAVLLPAACPRGLGLASASLDLPPAGAPKACIILCWWGEGGGEVIFTASLGAKIKYGWWGGWIQDLWAHCLLKPRDDPTLQTIALTKEHQKRSSHGWLAGSIFAFCITFITVPGHEKNTQIIEGPDLPGQEPRDADGLFGPSPPGRPSQSQVKLKQTVSLSPGYEFSICSLSFFFLSLCFAEFYRAEREPLHHPSRFIQEIKAAPLWIRLEKPLTPYFPTAFRSGSQATPSAR